MIKLGIYKHYKGGTYRTIGVGKYSEDLGDVVIYEALYDNKLSKVWARPLKDFESTVALEGKTIPRFEYIGEN
jgi:hypothetical protein